MTVCFIWVPTHVVGLEGNKDVDILAKQLLKSQTVDLQISLNKAEAKTIIQGQIQKAWQEYWDINDTGRHLYNIQKHVGVGIKVSRNQREEAVMIHLKIRHTGLNKTLHIIGKHPTGICAYCNQPESVQHVVMECSQKKGTRQKSEERD